MARERSYSSYGCCAAQKGFKAANSKVNAKTLRHVQHPALRADYVMANQPFNISKW